MRSSPKTWQEAIVLLLAEQQRLERLPTIVGGLEGDAEEVDFICLTFSQTGNWPDGMTSKDRNAVVQRFEWARFFAATHLNVFRKADGTETGRLQFPENCELEPLLIWFLVETWRSFENRRDALKTSIPPRHYPQYPIDSATN